MAARSAPKPLELKRKIRKLLASRHRERFGSPARVRVQARGYKDYLDLFVTSAEFRRILLPDRASLVGSWLREGLNRREYARVGSLLPLTPDEERRLAGGPRLRSR